VPSSKSSERLQVASAPQASGFRSDVTVFRLHARPRQRTGSLSAFRRNTAEHAYILEAAHNPEVAGPILPPLRRKALGTGPFLWGRERDRHDEAVMSTLLSVAGQRNIRIGVLSGGGRAVD
jgi:hypothetical protein